MYSPIQPDSFDSSAAATALAPSAGIEAAQRERASQLTRTAWAVAILAWLAYAGYFVQLTSFPFQDYPNHITRAAILAIPPGAQVLPVYTAQPQMDIEPLRHIASFVTLDRRAIIPYLFSADRGDLMKYFTYKHRPYMPEESWYKAREFWSAATEATYEIGGQHYTWRFLYARADHQWEMAQLVPMDWNRVACEYDYLLVMMPYQPEFIEVATTPVAYNETAALLAVDKKVCRPGVAPPRKVKLPLER